MAWERLALVQAVGENTLALQKVADVFGFESKQPLYPFPKPDQADESGGDQKSRPDPVIDSAISQTMERPSALFLRVNRIEQLASQNEDTHARPHYLDNPELHLDLASAAQGTYRFAPPSTLLSMPRLLPFLHHGLGPIKTAGRIDFSRLTRQIAQGKSIRRLPHVQQRRWPQRLHIIVDTRMSLEPFWSDFAFIISQLKKWLGADAVTAIRFDEATFGEPQMHAIAWPTKSHDRWFTWHVPASEESLLILSDLGMTEIHSGVRHHWQQFFQRLRLHPAPILTMSPAIQSPQNRQFCQLARPNPLHDWVRLPRHPSKKGFHLPEPDTEVVNDVLAWLSVLPIVDTGLLRRLRKSLQWGGSELECLIWNHPHVNQTSLGIRIQDSVAETYRQRYQQKFAGTEAAAQQFWQIVHDHHAKAFEGLRQLEALNRGIVENEHDAEVQTYCQRLCATLAQAMPESPQHVALQTQSRTMLESLPDSVWSSQLDHLAYDLYAMVHQAEIRAGQWPESLPPGFDPTRLQWILDEEQRHQRVQWHVLQTGAQGQFICQPRTEATISRLPSIAVVESHPAIPPTYQSLSDTLSRRGIVRPAQGFSAANAPLVLEIGVQRVELQAIPKPNWALSIRANRSGLAVDLPTWQGKSATAPWQPGSGSTPGYWQIPIPLGLDEFSLYADLNFQGVIQRFRWITPGTFLMGSPESEPERRGDEIQHSVTLTQGFWLADSACTQALWEAVMGDNPAFFKDTPDHPVENVSWDDVQRFIQVLNAQLPDLQARLPSEAEWEYACRAGTTTPFSFGNTISPEQVNYNGNLPYVGAAKGWYREKTVPVKSLSSNFWGLYEMHGNVWEWCADWYDDYPIAAVVDSLGPATQHRVLRGGSWHNYARRTRSAYRDRNVPANRGSSIGFRFALGSDRISSPVDRVGETVRSEAEA